MGKLHLENVRVQGNFGGQLGKPSYSDPLKKLL